MKILINAKRLAPILTELARVSPSRATLPILMNAKLVANADAGVLHITATDLNMTLTRTIAAEVKEGGEITVPVMRLNELFSVFPDQMATLQYSDKKGSLRIACAGTKADLRTIDSMEFPATQPDGAELLSMDFSAEELAAALKEVVFAASDDMARPLLMGVMFDIREQQMNLAGADGFRLAWRTLALPKITKNPIGFTILAAGVREIIKMLAGHETVTISVWPGQDHIKFVVPDASLMVVALNGDYPDFSPMFEKFKEKPPTRAVVSVNALNNACRVCSVIAKETSYISKIAINPNGKEVGSVTLSALQAEIGTTEGTVDATIVGDGIETGINISMIQDILSAVGNGEIAIEFYGDKNPVMFKPVGRDDYRNVVMPVQIPGMK